jgi:hypothetical protein
VKVRGVFWNWAALAFDPVRETRELLEVPVPLAFWVLRACRRWKAIPSGSLAEDGLAMRDRIVDMPVLIRELRTSVRHSQGGLLWLGIADSLDRRTYVRVHDVLQLTLPGGPAGPRKNVRSPPLLHESGQMRIRTPAPALGCSARYPDVTAHGTLKAELRVARLSDFDQAQHVSLDKF